MPDVSFRAVVSFAWMAIAATSCRSTSEQSGAEDIASNAPFSSPTGDSSDDIEAPRNRSSGLALVFYQRSQVFVERAPATDALARYLGALNAASYDLTGKAVHRHGFAVVVAIDREQRSRVWLVPDPGSFQDPPSGLTRHLEDVPSPAVPDGPFVFALRYGFARDRWSHPSKSPPIPDEWKLSEDTWEAAVATMQDGALLDSALRDAFR